MQPITRAAALLLLCLSGCGETYWEKDGASGADFETDRAQCMMIAEGAPAPASQPASYGIYSPGGQYLGTGRPTPQTSLNAASDQLGYLAQKQRIATYCMQSRGWRKAEK